MRCNLNVTTPAANIFSVLLANAKMIGYWRSEPEPPVYLRNIYVWTTSRDLFLSNQYFCHILQVENVNSEAKNTIIPFTSFCHMKINHFRERISLSRESLLNIVTRKICKKILIFLQILTFWSKMWFFHNQAKRSYNMSLIILNVRKASDLFSHLQN